MVSLAARHNAGESMHLYEHNMKVFTVGTWLLIDIALTYKDSLFRVSI